MIDSNNRALGRWNMVGAKEDNRIFIPRMYIYTPNGQLLSARAQALQLAVGVVMYQLINKIPGNIKPQGSARNIQIQVTANHLLHQLDHTVN